MTHSRKMMFCMLIMLFCLGGCFSTAQDAEQSSSEPVSSIVDEIESSSEPISPIVDEIESSSEPISSIVEEIELPSKPIPSEDEISAIPPNNAPSYIEPPIPDGHHPSWDGEIETRSGEYEEGKIFVYRVKIMGTMYSVEVQDEAVKEQILAYVDSMEPSDYNAENTPPGAGKIVSVEVHRNDEIEAYGFSSQIKDGHALGKNLQDPNWENWSITNIDAYDYLFSLLPVE